MAQLNVEIDDHLLKKVKYACIDHKIKLKALVSAALEVALDELKAAAGGQAPIEVIDEPNQPAQPSKAKQVEKS